MSGLNSLLRPSLCRNGVRQGCARAFASAGPGSDGGQTNSFKAMLDIMSKDKPRSAPQPRSRTPLATSPRADRPANRSGGAYTLGTNIIRQSQTARKNREASPEVAADWQRMVDRQDYERMMTRNWKAGDVYSPHDLSGVEMGKWRTSTRKGRPKKDVFDILKINPVDHYKNFAMMSEYMSDMGRIRHSNDTGLRPVNQRKIAKAVRRAIGLGLMPSVHKHPEILKLNQR